MSSLGTIIPPVLALFTGACSAVYPGSDKGESTPVVTATGTAPLTADTIQWIDGTYGAGCAARTGSWSARVSGSATMDYTALSVVMNNTGCVLTLTKIIADQTYTTTSPIAMTTSYAGSASQFTGSGSLSFYANAMLSSASFASTFTITLLYSANPNLLTSSLATGYASVSSSPSTAGSNAPNYTLDLTTGVFTATVSDTTSSVQAVSGTANLVQGTTAGGGYYVDQGILPSTPTFAQLDSAYASATPTTISGTPVLIPASAFGLTGVSIGSPVVRTLVIQRNNAGVYSYQTFAITFSCGGACGVCPAGESSKADSSGHGAANACCASAATTLNCNGTCVNLQSDNNNCGSCGTACPTSQGEFCQAGQCQVCGWSSNDLSGIGTGDFTISFTMQSTATSGSERAIINQRSVCSGGAFWDLRISSAGYLFIETDDGSNDLQLTPTVQLNDSQQHTIMVQRSSQVLTGYVNGTAVTAGLSLANWSGQLQALQTGSGVCDGTNSALTVGSVCINPGAAPPVANGTYEFLDGAGWALDDPNGGGAGTGADQVLYTGMGSNQNWTVTRVAANKYKILAANGTALTGSSSFGQLTLQSYTGASNQLWIFASNGAQYNIINASTQQAMDSNGGGTGHQVIQYTWSITNANQTWTLINRSTIVPLVANGTYAFVDTAGYALDDPNGGGSGTVPDQVTYSGANQKWTVTLVNGLEYKIIAASGAALTATGSNGTIAPLSSYTGVAGQLWVIQPNGSTYNLLNVDSSLALDDNSGGSGSTCHQWTFTTNNTYQMWTLVPH